MFFVNYDFIYFSKERMSKNKNTTWMDLPEEIYQHMYSYCKGKDLYHLSSGNRMMREFLKVKYEPVHKSHSCRTPFVWKRDKIERVIRMIENGWKIDRIDINVSPPMEEEEDEEDEEEDEDEEIEQLDPLLCPSVQKWLFPLFEKLFELCPSLPIRIYECTIYSLTQLRQLSTILHYFPNLHFVSIDICPINFKVPIQMWDLPSVKQFNMIRFMPSSFSLKRAESYRYPFSTKMLKVKKIDERPLTVKTYTELVKLKKQYEEEMIVEIVTIVGTFDKQVDKHIPNDVKYLYIGYEHSSEWMYFGQSLSNLPLHLEILELHGLRGFNEPLDRLPPRLKTLVLSDLVDFQQPLDKLPQSLTSLSLHGCNDSSMKKLPRHMVEYTGKIGNLPNLEHLKINWVHFRTPLNFIASLSRLDSLKLSEFNTYFDYEWHIPKSLCDLYLHYTTDGPKQELVGIYSFQRANRYQPFTQEKFIRQRLGEITLPANIILPSLE